MPLILRRDKGMPLTHDEADDNIVYVDIFARSPLQSIEDKPSGTVVATCNIETLVSVGYVANAIRLWPFVLGRSVTASLIHYTVNSTGSNNVKFMVFDNAETATTNRPSTRIAIVSSAATMSSRGPFSRALEANVTLEAGRLYWIGYVSSSTAGSLVGTMNASLGALGMADGGWNMTTYYGVTMLSVYATPDSVFTFTNWPTNGISQNYIPRFFFNDVS